MAESSFCVHTYSTKYTCPFSSVSCSHPYGKSERQEGPRSAGGRAQWTEPGSRRTSRGVPRPSSPTPEACPSCPTASAPPRLYLVSQQQLQKARYPSRTPQLCLSLRNKTLFHSSSFLNSPLSFSSCFWQTPYWWLQSVWILPWMWIHRMCLYQHHLFADLRCLLHVIVEHFIFFLRYILSLQLDLHTLLVRSGSLLQKHW